MPKITNQEKNSVVPYGAIRSPDALGQLFRAARKAQGLTLHDVHSASGLSMRFLSEFERGKPNVSLAKVMSALQILGLECLVFSRKEAGRVLKEQALQKAGEDRNDPGR